jgi:hypothetical protein
LSLLASGRESVIYYLVFIKIIMASGSSSSSNWVMESGDIPHVLAVDDSLVDRKLVEKLLRNSSCKGIPI